MAITLTEVLNKTLARDLMHNPGRYESLESVAGKALSAASTVAGNAVAAGISDNYSLSQFTQASNLEPRVMIEETLRLLPNLDKWLYTLTNLYSAYYLHATALSGDVNGVSVISRLDKFNPNRNPLNTIVAAIAAENYLDYGYVLPAFNKPQQLQVVVAHSKAAEKLALEDYDAHGDQTGHMNTNNGSGTINNTVNKNVDKSVHNVTHNHIPEPKSNEISQSLKQIADVDNLAVGRMLEVVLMINGKTVKVPVSVRMRPMSVPKLIIRELVALGDIRNSWKERWHRMRAGELNIVSDWIFQSDRIKEKRKLLALDKQGIYKEMLARKRNAKAAAAMSGTVSIGSASSFIIISKATAKEVELRTGMSIDNVEFRNRVFGENSAMMILVVDTEWETIDAYTRGVPGVANWTFKQFEGMSKGNGPDITEIMKAYTLGQNPRF